VKEGRRARRTAHGTLKIVYQIFHLKEEKKKRNGKKGKKKLTVRELV
jgi:hypothetical protein